MKQGTPVTATSNDTFNTTMLPRTSKTEVLTSIPEPPGMTVTRLVLFGVVFVAAMIGNFFVFTASFRNRRLRTFSYCLIMNLAISDFISILGVPFLIVNEELQPTWIYGSFLCKFINPTQVVCGLVTTNIHVAIAIDRYFSIVRRSFRYSSASHCRSHKGFMVVLLIWVMAIVCALPAYTFRKLISFTSAKSGLKVEFCIELFPSMGDIKLGWRHIYSVFLFFINYLLPISISTVLYGIIIRHLKKTELKRRKSGRKISQSSGSEPKNSDLCHTSTYLERRFIFMAVVIVIIFFVCYLPFQVVFLLFEFNYGVSWPYFRIVTKIVYFLTWLPNALNPLCYGAMDQRYASAFRRICASIQNTNEKKNQNNSLSRGQSARVTEEEV